ncbi:hypothetical protein A1O7_05919, partial [Cladophialophora yegresii CBS 114405]
MSTTSSASENHMHVGDIQARDRTKDVLITLQMSLIINLKTIYMDEIEMDFHMLQATSDDCRVNARVCLGQLAQRLSDSTKAEASYPQQSANSSGCSGFMPSLSPSLGYSSSRSTYSSTAFQAFRRPDAMTEQVGELNRGLPFFSPTFEERKMLDTRKMPMSSAASQGRHFHSDARTSVNPHRIEESHDRSLCRRSSQTLALDDNILLMFPRPGGQPIP